MFEFSENRMPKKCLDDRYDIQSETEHPRYDIVLVGAGIMSATLAYWIQKMNSDLKIAIVESSGEVASDTSFYWRNAGTGHAANCEPNYYTPEGKEIYDRIWKAVNIHNQFLFSMLTWGQMMKEGILTKDAFIKNLQHASLALSKDEKVELKARFKDMKEFPFFEKMQLLEDRDFQEAFPLVSKAGISTVIDGTVATDINFGNIATSVINHLQRQEDIDLILNTTVQGIKQDMDGKITMLMKDVDGNDIQIYTNKTFVGSGGTAMHLMRGFGNDVDTTVEATPFPVSGEFLVCWKPDIVRKHKAKLYKRAAPGSPPMSSPHLDSRWSTLDELEKVLPRSEFDDLKSQVNSGQITTDSAERIQVLSFGPFAGLRKSFSNSPENKKSDIVRFMLQNPDAILSMLKTMKENFSLVTYLTKEVLTGWADALQKNNFRANIPGAPQSLQENLGSLIEKVVGSQMDSLQQFVPDANLNDWIFVKAGARAQIINPDGTVALGTEINNDIENIVALFGASPGASVSPKIMFDALCNLFPEADKNEIFLKIEGMNIWREMQPKNIKSITPKEDKKIREKYVEIIGILEERFS